MKGIIHPAIPRAACLLAAFVAAAQTPPDTNAPPARLESQPQLLQTNFQAAPAPVLWPALTNQFGPQPIPTQPGVLTNMSGMTGPSIPGSGVIGSPLMGTGSFGGGSAFGGAGASPAGGLLRWGPFDFHPYVGYSFLSESGIGSRPGQHNGTTVNTISEGLSVNLGSRWIFNYGASSAFYSGSGYSDETSQFLSLSGSASWKDWLFGLSQAYSQSSEPLVETGAQTSQVGYGTALTASRQLGSRLSFYAGANQMFRFTSKFNNIEEWSGSSGLNYQLFPQLSVGLGVGGGYDVVSQGPNIQFEEIQGVIGFHPGQRFSLNLSGGVEVQQFVGANASAFLTPVYAVSAGYLLSQATVLTLTAARTATPSYFTDLDNVSSIVSLQIQQRLTRKLGLEVAGGFRDTSFIGIEPGLFLNNYIEYVPIIPTAQIQGGEIPYIDNVSLSYLAPVRSDTTSFVQASLHYAFVERLTASAFYSYNQNSSSQVGVQLRYQY